MRKIIAIFCIMTGLSVLYISTSKDIMAKISERRENAPWRIWWGPHHADNAGDLARMAYLENVMKYRDTVVHNFVKADPGNRSVNLYVWGDSYVKDIPDSVFCGLKSYHFGRRDYSDLTYELDTAQTNILVIELGERFLRRYFYTADGIFQHVKKAEKTAAIHMLYPVAYQKTYAAFGLPEFKISELFNSSINQNIEYNLFTYNFMTPIRRFKAEMNAKLFLRGSGDVVISEDGNFLLLRETVGREDESSTVPVAEKGISYFVSVLNQVHDHYKQEGFDEVYLSVIPNPVSILQPGMYNKVLPNLQNYERGYNLSMPAIDMYKAFSEGNDPGSYYLKGDTHWSEKGKQLWIDKLNAMLKSWDSGNYESKKPW